MIGILRILHHKRKKVSAVRYGSTTSKRKRLYRPVATLVALEKIIYVLAYVLSEKLPVLASTNLPTDTPRQFMLIY
jgi:hypothetical protein